MEGHEPDREDLGYVHVEYEIGFVECCRGESALARYPKAPLLLVLSNALRDIAQAPTNSIDIQFDRRAHNLVPAEDGMDQPPAALEAAGAAEGMSEGGIGGEVLVDSFFLLLRRALGQAMDDGGDLLDWVFHRVRSRADELSARMFLCWSRMWWIRETTGGQMLS